MLDSPVMATERTFAMVKPDGVRRNLAGTLIKRIEARGFRIVGLKLMQISRETAEQHYGEHKGKPFFAGLVDFITSGPVVAISAYVWDRRWLASS